MARRRRSIEERFFSKVQDTGECWEWAGSKYPNGYGSFGIQKETGEWVPTPAHRIAYLLHKGPIPEGLEIDHLCRNRSCVNPDHLEAVTHAENKDRAFGVVCPRGHPRTPETIGVNNVGGRFCRVCQRENVRASKERRLLRQAL